MSSSMEKLKTHDFNTHILKKLLEGTLQLNKEYTKTVKYIGYLKRDPTQERNEGTSRMSAQWRESLGPL